MRVECGTNKEAGGVFTSWAACPPQDNCLCVLEDCKVDIFSLTNLFMDYGRGLWKQAGLTSGCFLLPLWYFHSHETALLCCASYQIILLSIMCHVGVSLPHGVMKGALCQPTNLIALCQTVCWTGGLILGCIAAPPAGRSINSVRAIGPQVTLASYTDPRPYQLGEMRHRHSAAISIYRSAAPTRARHGEWCLVVCSRQYSRMRVRDMHGLAMRTGNRKEYEKFLVRLGSDSERPGSTLQFLCGVILWLVGNAFVC